jgi:hypothetical protein
LLIFYAIEFIVISTTANQFRISCYLYFLREDYARPVFLTPI